MNANLDFLIDNYKDKRIFALQGGTRSGKTYAALYWIIRLCERHSNLTISIVRRSMPALRATVMRDFFDILHTEDIYERRHHSKRDNEYTLWGNRVEFFSIDDEQKLRGRKRDILFVNEANEIRLDQWRQLMHRTGSKAVLDYNPSMEQGWIYSQVLTRPECGSIITTYLDNPFLPAEVVAEIEQYKQVDPNYWRVYGLGQRGLSNSTIYTHWREFKPGSIGIEGVALSPNTGNVAYGLDFGFNQPTALVKCTFNTDKKTVWAEELLYKPLLTNTDLIQWFADNHIPHNAIVYADAAEPARIEEFYRAGWRGVKPADKNVTPGIDSIKSTILYISENSINLIKELYHYKWHVDKDNNVVDSPVKINDHAADALRYAIYTHKVKPQVKYLFI